MGIEKYLCVGDSGCVPPSRVGCMLGLMRMQFAASRLRTRCFAHGGERSHTFFVLVIWCLVWPCPSVLRILCWGPVWPFPVCVGVLVFHLASGVIVFPVLVDSVSFFFASSPRVVGTRGPQFC